MIILVQFEYIANFHIGESLTALQKVTLTAGGSEVLVYSTVMGSIGALVPLLTKDEVSMAMCRQTITLRYRYGT